MFWKCFYFYCFYPLFIIHRIRIMSGRKRYKQRQEENFDEKQKEEEEEAKIKTNSPICTIKMVHSK